MKNSIINFSILFFLLFSCTFTYGQSRQKKAIYSIWLYQSTNAIPTTGYLYELKDSSIVLSRLRKPSKKALFEVNVENIISLQLRKSGQIGRGLLIGSITGFTIGYLWGYSEGMNCSEWLCFDPVVLGVSGGVLIGSIGGIVGIIVGMGGQKIKIPIDRKQLNYQNQKVRLEKLLKKGI